MDITLTEIELKQILESLLFTSSCDTCGDWTNEDYDNFLELAIKLNSKYESEYNKPLILDKNKISIDDDIVYEDYHRSKLIKKIFNI